MATRVLLPREQVFSNIGIVGSGYRLFFYETGTTTKKDTYSDEDLNTPNSNPVVADSAGRFGDIWISDSSLYKCVLAPAGTDDPATNPIWTADPINLNNSGIITINPLPVAYWGTTTGTSTSYLLDIPNLLVPIESYTNVQCFLVDIHIACGNSPVFNINGLGAVDGKKKTGQGTKVDLQAGDLQVGRYLAFNDGVDIVFYNTRGEALYLGSQVELAVATNEIILTNQSANYVVNTSSAAQTINTISGMVAGEVAQIGISSNSNAATFSTGVGNIINPNGCSVVLSSVNHKIIIYYDGTNIIITEYPAICASGNSLLTESSAPVSLAGTTGTSFTVAHSLGVVPQKYQAFLKCTTAQFGYAVGDETLPKDSDTNDNGPGYGFSLIPSSTNTTVVVGNTGKIIILRRDAGNVGEATSITLSSWSVIIRVSKYF